MFAIEESEFTVIVIITVSSLFIMIQWVMANSEFIKEFLYGERLTDASKISYFLFTKFSGLIILGVLPAFVLDRLLPHYSLSDYGLSFSGGAYLISFYWIAVLAPGIIMINWFAAKNQKAHLIYPQILVKNWDPKLLGTYSMACSIYLFAFELLFRGFLFFPLANSIGLLPAISINLLLCTISQTPKGLNETIGRLLFSLVLCVATIQTETIWVAFFAHVVSTLSNNLFALLFHPEMRIVKARNR